MTLVRKIRKTVTLDEDLVEVLGDDGNLSAAINRALRRDVDQRRRTESLGAWLDELAAERGSLDEAEVASAMARLQ